MKPSLPTLTPAGFGLILAGALSLLLVLFNRDLYRSIREPALLISEIMARESLDPSRFRWRVFGMD